MSGIVYRQTYRIFSVGNTKILTSVALMLRFALLFFDMFIAHIVPYLKYMTVNFMVTNN